MVLISSLVMILAALICGGIAQVLVGYSREGFWAAVVAGYVGGLLAWWLVDFEILPLIWAVTLQGYGFPMAWILIGGTLFAVVFSLIRKRRQAR